MDKFKYNSGKVYEIYSNIKNTKVNYINRYNISIFADIFFPENFDANKKYPAIIVGHPHEAKESKNNLLDCMPKKWLLKDLLQSLLITHTTENQEEMHEEFLLLKLLWKTLSLLLTLLEQENLSIKKNWINWCMC